MFQLITNILVIVFLVIDIFGNLLILGSLAESAKKTAKKTKGELNGNSDNKDN